MPLKLHSIGTLQFEFHGWGPVLVSFRSWANISCPATTNLRFLYKRLTQITHPDSQISSIALLWQTLSSIKVTQHAEWILDETEITFNGTFTG